MKTTVYRFGLSFRFSIEDCGEVIAKGSGASRKEAHLNAIKARAGLQSLSALVKQSKAAEAAAKARAGQSPKLRGVAKSVRWGNREPFMVPPPSHVFSQQLENKEKP